MMHSLDQIIDWGMITAALAVLGGVIPVIAAVLPLVWWGIKIYKEVRDWDKKDPEN